MGSGSKVVAESCKQGKECQGPERSQCKRKVVRAKASRGRMVKYMMYPNPRQHNHSDGRVHAKERHS